MPIPGYQTLMLPLLELASDGNEYSMQEARAKLATKFGMTEEEQNTLLPSSGQPVFANRVGWARTYLTKAGALDAPRRGVFQIADREREILREQPRDITVKFLKKFPEFIEFTTTHSKQEQQVSVGDSMYGIVGEKQTAEETLAAAYQRLRRDTEITGVALPTGW